METPRKKPPTAFIELAEFQKVGVHELPVRGHIIKAKSVVLGKNERVGIADSDPDQPTLVIHKSGEVIESAEFICKCGRSASIQFDYDHQ